MVIGRGSRREHPQPTFCSTTKKKNAEKTGYAQNILPVKAASGQGLFRWRDRRHFRWKGPTKVDIA